MGREVRRVKYGWAHPVDEDGHFVPLMESEMPQWSDAEKTFLVMYETCTEGTPISPGLKTPEELAHWLADNRASASGDITATYEQWLATIKAGWAPTVVFDSHGLRSGVEASLD